MGLFNKFIRILSFPCRILPFPCCEKCGKSNDYMPFPFSKNGLFFCFFKYVNTDNSESIILCKRCLKDKKNELKNAGVVYKVIVIPYFSFWGHGRI